MEWVKGKSITLLVVFLNLILTLFIIKSCFNIVKVNYILIALLYSIGVLITWIYDEKIKSLEKKLIVTMVALCFILLIVIVFREYAASFVIDGIGNNANILNNNMIKGYQSDFRLIRNLLIIIVPLLVPLMMFIAKSGMADIFILINTILMTLYWYLGYVEEINKSMFSFTFISIATYASNHLEAYTKRLVRGEFRNSVMKSKIIWTALIMSLITSTLIIFLPKASTGKYSKLITDRVVENVTGNGDFDAERNGYSLAKSGYSDTTKSLGGPISINDKEALKLEYKGESKDTIYLKGSVKDKYTGYSWNSDFKQIEAGDMLDTSYDYNFVGNNEEFMTIYPDYVTTTTLFVPYYPKVLTVKNKSNNTRYVDKANQTFYSQSPMKLPYTIAFYSGSSYEKNFDNPPAKTGNYETIELLNNGDLKRYLELPDTITQRTVDLVYSIVKGTASNEEKAYRLRQYLTKNYQYSLDVSQIPKGRDFVDYFLFDEKKGYCVYFATAMTVMCRIAGIPARYVEGFKVDNNRATNGTYKVTNEDAHAWTEIYLGNQFSDGNDTAKSLVFSKIDTAPSAYEYRHKKDVQNNNSNIGGNSGTLNSKPSSTSNTENNSKDQNIDKKGNVENKPLIYERITIIVSPILIVLAYIILRVILIKRNISKIKTSDSLIPLYEHSLKRLRKIRIKKDISETDLEFARSIEDRELSVKLEDLTNKVYKEFYGKEKDSEYDRTLLINYVESIVKAKQGTIVYIIKKYVLF